MKQVHLNHLFFFLQVRDFPVKSTEDGELDDEAQWIYQHAFLEFPISQQQVWLVTVHQARMYWFGWLKSRIIQSTAKHNPQDHINELII